MSELCVIPGNLSCLAKGNGKIEIFFPKSPTNFFFPLSKNQTFMEAHPLAGDQWDSWLAGVL